MANIEELENAMRDATAAGNFSDAQAFYKELVKLKPETRMPRASDQFQYRQTTSLPMGQEWEERQVKVKEGIAAEEWRNTVIIGVGFVLIYVVVAWGWGKWKLRFAGCKARARAVSLECVWIVSKCALAIATTVLILNLIRDRPWLWFLRH